MAMSSGGGSAGSINEPNVTPMIDVLLVLLIIFMAVLPSMRKAIDVQLPDPNPPPSDVKPKDDQIVLEVQGPRKFSINKQPPLDLVALAPKMHELFDTRPDKILFIKGDSGVKLNDVMEAMDVVRGAVFHIVIALVPKETAPTGAAPAPAGGK